MTKTTTRRAPAAVAILAGATALFSAGFAAPASATVDGYSTEVQNAAVAAITSSEGISTAAALDVLRVQDASARTLAQVENALAGRHAGGFLDAKGLPVVNVLDAAGAAQAQAAGATAKVVKHSLAQLDAARAVLEPLGVAHTTIGTDEKTNQIVVTVSDAATGADALVAKAASLGDAVRVERTTGQMSKAIYNGEAITGGGTRCSAGFNVTRGGQLHILDAGHCTRAVSQWNVGPSVGASFPTNDYGLIRNTTGSGPGAVTLWNGSTQRISSAADARVGQQICKSGSTTRLTCGVVEATNVTVRYQEGPVYQTVQTSASVNPGDSGGCLFSGSVGLGITSGMGGGNSYFQPVVEAMNAYGAQLT
ncbi:S1 family peptidase [Amycolatopsis suaedae]|uniref:Trypsin n=1 Tax=Amycolatopsis suaedae TaxID=2510978 RepID=A0A4Q7JCD3_9PSEU|nr:S1 family peptidase [Amycolatopsis suaedae]RZQ64193.1 trypsin [Amycolatopsis suaedae]